MSFAYNATHSKLYYRKYTFYVHVYLIDLLYSHFQVIHFLIERVR